MTTPQMCCPRPNRLQHVLERLRRFHRAWVALREARYRALQAILDDTESRPRDE